jgi:NTP pyrophosphatase (non-canonical NTP hydrolase)
MQNLRGIQAAHKEWVARNFGERQAHVDHRFMNYVISLLAESGKVAHHALKADQGIRGTVQNHEDQIWNSLSLITGISMRWSQEQFTHYKRMPIDKSRRFAHCVFGIAEELSETIRAFARDDESEVCDGMGDIFMYWLDGCNTLGVDAEQLIIDIASKVHQRDWNANPETGEVSK